MNDTTYNEILKVWNYETPDDFAIFSELYYHFFFLSLRLIMRIFFLALFVILGANLGIELLDSNMTQIIKDRNQTIQRSINNL